MEWFYYFLRDFLQVWNWQGLQNGIIAIAIAAQFWVAFRVWKPRTEVYVRILLERVEAAVGKAAPLEISNLSPTGVWAESMWIMAKEKGAKESDLPPVIGPPSMLVHTPLQPGGAERNPAVTAGSLPGLAAGSPTRCAGELCYTPAAIPQSTPSLPARCKRSLHSETRLETSR